MFGLTLGLHPVASSQAQTIIRAGGESTPLGRPSGEQVWPSVSANGSGGWVVWEDNTIEGPGRGRGIAAAQLGADLAISGNPVRVNSTTAGNQEKPQVALLTGGNAMVTWETHAVTAGGSGLYARLLSPAGTTASAEVQVSPGSSVSNVKQTVRWSGVFKNKAATRTYKFKEKISEVREHAGAASLVPLPDGGSIVVYHGVRRTYTNSWALVRETKYNGIRSTTNDVLRPVRFAADWMKDVYFQRFDATGAKVGSEVRVNQYDSFNQRDPSATLLANGNLLIVWISERQLSSRTTDNFSVSLYAREMTIGGEGVGSEFAVGEDATRASANPVVVTLSDGFGIYWSQHEATLSRRWNIYGRVFASAGRPSGQPVLINVHTPGDQYGPRVAAGVGNQFIVWTSLGQDGSREGVYGRALSDGLPIGDELPVNTTSPSRQYQPAVSAVGAGRFLAVWSGFSGTSGFDLFSQVYQTNAAQQ